MSFWNYVGRFLLLRWLFGNRDGNHCVDDSRRVDATDYMLRDVEAEDYYTAGHEFNAQTHRDYSRRDYRSAYIYDDEDDALDDYDPSDGDDYTFDDFLDERDDYDLMDDDF